MQKINFQHNEIVSSLVSKVEKFCISARKIQSPPYLEMKVPFTKFSSQFGNLLLGFLVLQAIENYALAPGGPGCCEPVIRPVQVTCVQPKPKCALPPPPPPPKCVPPPPPRCEPPPPPPKPICVPVKPSPCEPPKPVVNVCCESGANALVIKPMMTASLVISVLLALLILH